VVQRNELRKNEIIIHMSFILQVDFNWLRFFINNHSKIEKNRNKEQNMVIQLGVSS